MAAEFKYLYGPVSSWRLGVSLGVDLLSQKKRLCNFDCVYCQLGRSGTAPNKRKIFVPTQDVMRELKALPPAKIDFITFSGRGEPALAKNLGAVIRAIRRIRKERIAVLTNGSLMDDKSAQKDLSLADWVVVKLDACSQETLRAINRPIRGLDCGHILAGILAFRKKYKTKVALQMMFVKENKGYLPDFADWIKRIKPDELQINTPLRPGGAKPLPREDIFRIREYFRAVCAKGAVGKKMRIVSAYDKAAHRKAQPLTGKAALSRRGRGKG